MSDSQFANIIFEDPARDDAFHGKGHLRTAKALADSIKQLADNKDGAIGLEGAWGSGKSTVLLMAEDALKEQDAGHDYRVFTFDLWTHHTDEFKRAFLEEFLTWCTPWLSPEQVEEQRGRIRNRVKEVDTTNRRTFSFLGIVLVLLLPFLPIAVSWISPVAFRESTEVFLLGFTLPEFILRVLFMLGLVPILVLLAKVLAEWLVWPIALNHVVPWWKRRQKSSGDSVDESPIWQRVSLATLSSEVLSLFSRDSRRDTVTQNIRDEDPTTVEFYKVFRELLVLVQNGKRRVVIVLDNIDRLPISAVPAAWSEVRSVFAASDARVAAGNSRVIAVVPYDRSYIAEAFQRTKPAVSRRPSEPEVLQAASSPAADQSKAEPDAKPAEQIVPRGSSFGDGFRFADGDIFNKMFSRILKVSPPVGSHWGDFLNAAIDKAFGTQHNAAARNKLLRLLQVYFQRNLIHPTPRLIVGYVNEIGAYWSQRDGDIPVESIALFVLLRSKIDESPEALTTPNLVSERYLNIVDQPDHWLEHLAALAFNVSLEDAAEVLLGDEIRVALLADRPDRLAQLHKLNGFETFFQQFLAGILEQLASEDPRLIAAAALNVSEITLSEAVHQQVWKSFGRSVRLLNVVGRAGNDQYLGLAKIIEHQSKTDAIDIADDLRKKYTVVPSGTQVDTGETWARRAVALSQALERALSHNDAIDFWASSKLPNDGYFAAGVASALDPESEFCYAAIRGRPEAALLADTLDTMLEGPTDAFRRSISSLAPTLSDADKVNWLTKMAENLRGSDRPSKDAAEVMKAYVLLDHQFPHTSGQSGPLLKALVRDGTLLWYAHKGFQEEEASLLGDALILLFRRGMPVNPPPGAHPTFGAVTAASEWFAKILTSGDLPSEAVDRAIGQVSTTGALPEWISLAAQDQTESSLFAQIVRGVIRRETLKNVSPTLLINQYDNAKAILGDDEIRMLVVGLGSAHDANSIGSAINEDFIRGVSPDFVSDIAEYAPKSSLSVILQQLDAVLKAMTTDDWTISLANEDEMVSLAIARLRSGSLSLPAATFLEALQTHVMSVLVSDTKIQRDANSWNLLSSALTSASRKTLAARILASVPRSGISPAASETLVSHYRTLAESLPLEDNPSISVDVLLRALVQSPSARTMDYIRTMEKAFRKALKAAESDIVQSFADVIDGLYDGTDAQRERAVEVRTVLGLKSPKTKQEE